MAASGVKERESQMSKHTNGAGQRAEGSEVIPKHCITSATRGMLTPAPLSDEMRRRRKKYAANNQVGLPYQRHVLKVDDDG